MQITLLGLGNVGGTLARAWLRAGHELTVGRTTPDTPSPLTGPISVGTTNDALAAPRDVVVLATPAAAIDQILKRHSAQLGDAVIVDATNALIGPPTNSTNYQQALHQSELFRTVLPHAHHHRAFCSTGWESMSNPGCADVPHAGPAATSGLVSQLITDAGQRAWWLGDDPDAFDTLDGLARLWFQLAFSSAANRRIGITITDCPAA